MDGNGNTREQALEKIVNLVLDKSAGTGGHYVEKLRDRLSGIRIDTGKLIGIRSKQKHAL